MPEQQRRKVFVGSTRKDLIKHRAKVRAAIDSLGFEPLMMEREFEASDSDAVRLSLEKVDQADIYIGIFAHRYGYIPDTEDNPEKISITELEYNRADERGIPCLLFVVDEDAEWKPEFVEGEPGKSKLSSFKKRIGKKRVWKTFDKDADVLAEQVKISLLANPEKIDLPYAVFAMTKTEFEEFWACTDDWLLKCNARINDRQIVEGARVIFEDHGVEYNRLAACYREQRREWIPLSHSEIEEDPDLSSAKDIIDEITKLFNYQNSGKLLLTPRDYSDRLLSEDADLRDETNRELREKGCVIFVDAISLFHPLISARFESSHLGIQQPIIFMLPFNISSQPVNHNLHLRIKEVGHDIRLRFSQDMDMFCELNATNHIQLKRWFMSILPNLSDLMRHKRVNSSQREAVRKLAELHDIKSTGSIANLI